MKYSNPDIESSYQRNDLGKTLYNLVLKKKPKVIIEFGSLNGYSAVAMAMALHELGEGKVLAYDLFDKYPYKNSTRENTQKNIDRYGLSTYVELREGDFDEWLKKPEHFDFLHVDISNTGEMIQKLYQAVKLQGQRGATVVFEGGSKERDGVEWMVKYDKPRITTCGVPYKVIDERFPSLSEIIF